MNKGRKIKEKELKLKRKIRTLENEIERKREGLLEWEIEKKKKEGNKKMRRE